MTVYHTFLDMASDHSLTAFCSLKFLHFFKTETIDGFSQWSV